MVTTSVASEIKEAYTYENGCTVFDVIDNEFEKGNDVELSLDGFTVIPSSFANGCFVVLLEEYGPDRIRQNLKIIHSTRQINQMTRSRLESENVHINQAQLNISQPQVGPRPSKFFLSHLRQVRNPIYGLSNITRN